MEKILVTPSMCHPTDLVNDLVQGWQIGFDQRAKIEQIKI